MTSSISKMSSFPPLSRHGISPPLSLPSAMSSQRSSEEIISLLKRRSTAPSSLLSSVSSSGGMTAGYEPRLRICRSASASSSLVSRRTVSPPITTCQYPLCSVIGTITLPVTSPPRITASAL